MNETDRSPGELVIAEYKSGVYVGELLTTDGRWSKVRMLAVLKHPSQGDLHHPMQADVPMFHERRALSYCEVANVPAGSLKAWKEGEAPDYKASLKQALESEMEDMRSLGTPFGDRSAAVLQQLKKDYFK